MVRERTRAGVAELAPSGKMRIWALLCLGLATVGCSRDSPHRGDAGVATDASPPEPDPITLTLWPFWEIPVTATGAGAPSYLDGVTVCLRKKRGYGQQWSDFIDVTGPCTGPVPRGSKVVLAGVPPVAELVLTAEKPGYLSRAIAVATGQWDTDLTVDPPSPVTAGVISPLDTSQMHLFSLGSVELGSPGADLVHRGQIIAIVISMEVSFPEGGTLPRISYYRSGGVSVSVTSDAGDTARYFSNGSFVDAATSTLPGAISQFTGATLTNLPEGEYTLRASPNVGSGAVLEGFGFRDVLPNQIRVPVLDGFLTEAGMLVTCLPFGVAHTCAPSSEAGTP